jgi:MFS family permease
MSASSPAPSRPRASRVNPNAVLAVVAVAQFMVILDATVVNVALPTIRRHLGAPEDSGLASGLLNTTQQVGGSLGLAILATVSTTRINDALHRGAVLPAALTHGFKGGFTVSAIICATGAALALVLLPRQKRDLQNEDVETVALSFARCPGAPYCGYLARFVALGRRVRRRPAEQS